MKTTEQGTGQRILLTLGYDGTDYCGWQRQNHRQGAQRTVQQAVETALAALYGAEVQILGASRTDAGVHAQCQKATFWMPEATIPPERIYLALNSKLPPDIRAFHSAAVAADFHVIRDVQRKTYRYYIQPGEIQNPLRARYAYFVRGRLDAAAMKRAGDYLLGRHDFKAFCAANSGAVTTVREIYQFALWAEADQIVFEICGNGFLYNMIRIIAGTLIDVGKGKLPPERMEKIIAGGERTLAGKTAGPQGLVLTEIQYKQEEQE